MQTCKKHFFPVDLIKLKFEKSVSDLTQMDGPLQNAPLMRWQRKAQESGTTSPLRSQLPVCRTPGKPLTRTPGHSKTPGKNLKTPGKNPKTPGSCKKTKSPKITPGKHLLDKASNKKSTATPGKHQDRFIPNRLTTDQEVSHFALLNVHNAEDEENSQTNTQYQQHLSKAMLPHQASSETKILSFKTKLSVNNQINNLNVLYSTAKVPTASLSTARHIPSKPEHVLDAPDVRDDYYLHTFDWSNTNVIAAALGTDIYLWNANNSNISHLMNTETDTYICSLSWIADGSVLAVGISSGIVELWDVERVKRVRTMSGHAARVGCLDWNAHILTSGSRSGAIHSHDVRVADHHVATLVHHTQEICGLKWSSDGRFLASGANDNVVNVWDSSLGMDVVPLHTFTEHLAAVKAISWCPWQSPLLATGGGTSDRHIRFWNTTSGSCIKAVDTQSQVCSVLWSHEHRELISGHGYSLNQLSIWKYPSMTKVTDLTGHTSRILNLAMSPDGQTVGSMAADETIRLWKCFASEKQVKKIKSSIKSSSTRLHMSIR